MAKALLSACAGRFRWVTGFPPPDGRRERSAVRDVRSCGEVRRRLADPSPVSLQDLPAEMREHMEGCALCARALWARQIFHETLEALLRTRAARTMGK